MQTRDRFGLMALAVLCAQLPACRALEPGDPLRGLSAAERAQFEHGRTEFARTFTPETGLGPLFNADACSECHEKPVLGGTGDEVEVHTTQVRADGSCDALGSVGGPVLQQHATPALTAALGVEAEPDRGNGAKARRTTPVLFGRGLLDAVPDSAILAYADPDDRNHDGISGRPNRFADGRLGRFGRKAFVPTLREFNTAAFLMEQGITNPGAPEEESIAGMPIPAGVDPLPEPEISEQAVAAADHFVRLLAVPTPLHSSAATRRGRLLFDRTGCAACHVPELRTGRSKIAALNRKRFAAYTDLLLHDLGPELADICLGEASPAEFRTEPLAGLRVVERFLHDGRAASLEEAIALHGGEASSTRARFRALSERDRAALLAFLRSL